ncbi:MAG: hypothetical protein ACR2QT_03430 [Woeseiaceae bacterium]
MRIKNWLCIAALAIGPASADETEGTSDVTNEVVDEITVMGVRDLGSLRTELMRAEDEVYNLYNELNDDDDYDIICQRVASIGSQIKKRVCQSRLYRDALSEATEDEDGGILFAGSLVNEKKHSQILREKMFDVASKNPQLVIALRKRHALQQKFDSERDKKFGNDDD